VDARVRPGVADSPATTADTPSRSLGIKLVAGLYLLVGLAALLFGLYLSAISGASNAAPEIRSNVALVAQAHFVVGTLNVVNAVGIWRARRWAFWLSIALLAGNTQIFPLIFPPTFPLFFSFSPVAFLFAASVGYFLTRSRHRQYFGVRTRSERAAEEAPESLRERGAQPK